MENFPHVTTDIKDTANRVLWVIRAYRAPTEGEARTAITEHIRQHGVPTPNTRLELITTIGFQD